MEWQDSNLRHAIGRMLFMAVELHPHEAARRELPTSSCWPGPFDSGIAQLPTHDEMSIAIQNSLDRRKQRHACRISLVLR